MAKVTYVPLRKAVLLELKSQSKLYVAGDESKQVVVTALGPDAQDQGFAVGDEVIIKASAKLMRMQQGEHEFLFCEDYENIAFRVERSLIDV